MIPTSPQLPPSPQQKNPLAFRNWMRRGIVVMLLLTCGYAVLLAGVWGFARYRQGISNARFSDLLLPGRWPRHRQVVGEHYLALGRRQLEAGHSSAALHSLQQGLARASDNVDGRLLLASVLSAADRPDLAEQTLLAGIPHAGDDPAFLRALFRFLLDQQRDELVQACARDLLANPRLPPASAAVAALAAAQAAFLRGDYDRTEDFLRLHDLQKSPDGRLLAARIDWDRGYHALAITQARALLAEYPGEEAVQIQLGTWLRESGAVDESRRLALLREISHPESLGARIDRLHAQHRTDPAAAERAARATLREFAHDPAALTALAEFAAAVGDAPLAHHLYDHARRESSAVVSVAFLTAEAHLAARDFRGALAFLEELAPAPGAKGSRYESVVHSLQAVAFHGLGDVASARLHLSQYLAAPHLRADNLVAVASRLTALGATADAREVLLRAIAAAPRNQAALTQLITLDLAADRCDDLPARLRQLLALRRPSPQVLRAAHARLGSDHHLFLHDREETLTRLEHALAALPSGAVRDL